MNTTAEPTLDLDGVAALLARVREQQPLVQNITNYVAMTLSANVLLALGASPAMVHAVEEVEAFTTIAASLVINIGTLSPAWVAAMRLAAKRAAALHKPWVLDPVGCGATPYRTQVAAELAALRPAIIRGNASEVMSLAGAAGAGGKGVDSTAASGAALQAASALAARSGAVIAITGAIDYVTDGETVVAIDGGDPMMARSTAFGCALSATTAAFAAVAPPLAAAVAALTVFAASGRHAVQNCRGPGHLPAELCDALYQCDAQRLLQNASITSRRL